MRTGFAALILWAASGSFAGAQSGAAQSSGAPQLESVSVMDGSVPTGAWDDWAPGKNGAWFRADYLLWWVKNGPLTAPLVTTGSDADAPFQGALGRPGTRVLFGASDLDFGMASGLRLQAGLPLTADGQLSLEGSWLQLERRSVGFRAASDGTGFPVLARPIVNAANGAQNSELESSPLVGVVGGVQIAAPSRLQGWEINLAARRPRGPGVDVSALVGFRALDLNEAIVIQDSFRDATGLPGGAGLTFQGATVQTPELLTGFDSFRVHNHFYGPQIGGRLAWDRGALSLGLAGKIALGWSQEQVIIEGSSSAIVNPGDRRTTAAGSVLAQVSNIGRYNRDEFAVLPEFGLDVGAQVTRRLRAGVGYNFLYWSNVARPGNAIDSTVNRFIVPTDQNFGQGVAAARPAFNFHSTDYWAQGLNFTLEYRY